MATEELKEFNFNFQVFSFWFAYNLNAIITKDTARRRTNKDWLQLLRVQFPAFIN